MRTGSVRDCSVKWNSDNTNVEELIGLGETFQMLEVSEGIYASESPLSQRLARYFENDTFPDSKVKKTKFDNHCWRNVHLLIHNKFYFK
jgi:hypothetical protein